MNMAGRRHWRPPVELSMFEKLPVELRVEIYNLLEYPEVLKMREVNRSLKREIDDNMTFHMKFDQSTRVVKRLTCRRIRSCHILHFSSRRLFPRKIFTEPERIKKLTFDGMISPANVLRLLTQCKSVEHLIFTHQTLGIDSLLISERFTTVLSSLSCLTHLNLQLLRYPHEDPFEAEGNIETFLKASFAHLRSFRLYFSLFGNFTSLLNFLERHTTTLKEVELQVGDRGDTYGTERFLRSSPLFVAENQRNNLLSLNLTKFRFRDDVLNLNQPAKNLIMSIIMYQRKLQVLQFYSPGELSWSNLKDIIQNNFAYLNEVVVYNVKTTLDRGRNRRVLNNNLEPAVPESLDMSIFSKCIHLKTLALSCASSNGNNPNVGEGVVMKMSSLQSIPNSVERLHLTGFTLDGQELVELSCKGNKLKEILIADAGTMRYSEVLNNFLKNCLLLQYLNVRPVVLQAANDQAWWKEVNNLSKLYERFMGISYDPIDDLEGFEAKISESDKEWLMSYDNAKDDKEKDTNNTLPTSSKQ